MANNKIYMDVPRYTGCCNVCFSDANVKEITFRGNNSGTIISLCIDCREKLMRLLMHDFEILPSVTVNQYGKNCTNITNLGTMNL